MWNVTGQSLTVASLVAPTAATSPFDNSLVTGYGNVKWNLSTNQPWSFTDVKMANLEAYVLSMLTSGGNGYFSGSLWLKTTAPTHTLTLWSTWNGIALYNTADQTTNYEAARMYRSGNVFLISWERWTSATWRTIRIRAEGSAGSFSNINIGRSWVPYHQFTTNTSSATWDWAQFYDANTSSASSSVVNFVSIKPTINQSWTAWFTWLLINPTLTAQGSWLQLLQDWQTGGSSKAVMTTLWYLWLATTAPTHSITLGSTATGIALYNTADQTTNFERVRMLWSGNYYNIVAWKWWSTSARGIRIWANTSVDNLPWTTGVNYVEVGASNFIFYIRNSLSTTLGFGITSEWSWWNSISSWVFTCASIYPYIVHTWTAWRTMLDLNPTITTEWSWSKNFILCRKSSGSSLFAVDSNWWLISSRVVVPSWTTTPVTITSWDTNKVYTNEWATAKIVHNLPTAVAWLTYTFIVQDADGIDVVANTWDTIRRNTNVTAAGGTVNSTAIGSVLVLVAINDTEWIATTEIWTRA